MHDLMLMTLLVQFVFYIAFLESLEWVKANA